MIDVVITRHPALVEYLRENGIAEKNTPVLIHATAEDVRGRVVAGVLPLHLAAEAAAVMEIPLDLRPDQRGRELSLEEVRTAAQPARAYKVVLVPVAEVTGEAE